MVPAVSVRRVSHSIMRWVLMWLAYEQHYHLRTKETFNVGTMDVTYERPLGSCNFLKSLLNRVFCALENVA